MFGNFEQLSESIGLNCLGATTIVGVRRRRFCLCATNDHEQEEISGSTLRVYWYLLKKRENCGVREIQRALGFSSSSSAHYHLEKLVDKGLLTRDRYGGYSVNARQKQEA